MFNPRYSTHATADAGTDVVADDIPGLRRRVAIDLGFDARALAAQRLRTRGCPSKPPCARPTMIIDTRAVWSPTLGIPLFVEERDGGPIVHTMRVLRFNRPASAATRSSGD